MANNTITTAELIDIIIDSLDGYDVAYNNGGVEEWITQEECGALWKDDDDFDYVGELKRLILEKLPELRNDGVVNKTDDESGFVYARSAECVNTHFDYYQYDGLSVAIVNDDYIR